MAAISLVALSQITNQYLALVPMIGLGIGWASMIGLPSMMVSTIVPKKETGVYLGIPARLATSWPWEQPIDAIHNPNPEPRLQGAGEAQDLATTVRDD